MCCSDCYLSYRDVESWILLHQSSGWLCMFISSFTISDMFINILSNYTILAFSLKTVTVQGVSVSFTYSWDSSPSELLCPSLMRVCSNLTVTFTVFGWYSWETCYFLKGNIGFGWGETGKKWGGGKWLECIVLEEKKNEKYLRNILL